MPSKLTDYVRTAIDRTQGRSMVMSIGGIAASEHPLASQAGASILASGGSAVDAAIAVNAVMGVVAPMMNGVGGDLFAIVYDASSGELHGINASGWSPAALTIDRLRARRHHNDAAERHHLGHGTRRGRGLVDAERALRAFIAGRSVVPRDSHRRGRVPGPGNHSGGMARGEPLLRGDGRPRASTFQEVRRPQSGRSSGTRISRRHIDRSPSEGHDGFYQGSIARQIVSCSDRNGGLLSVDDLATYEAEWVAPLPTTYRGWTVYELPPNGQGIAALVMLNILERSPMASYGHNSAEALHTLIEAKKLAYADMANHVCDPAFHDVPVTAMLSKAYATRRAREIDPAARPARSCPRRSFTQRW